MEKEKERSGRQKKRSEDNIKELTGMDSASSIRAAVDRTSCEVICCAPMTIQGYGIAKTRLDRYYNTH